MEKAHDILKNVFGFDSFRPSQREVIHRLLVEEDNGLVLFPTGGGKSLTFQVPALCLDGLTLVISPLIALMRDQVDALCAKGVKAANLDSTLSMDRAMEVKSQVLDGTLKLLYVAPERLNNESFMAMMRRVKISLLAVDESHCISMWGASFRPEYLKIARFAEELDVERVLCLTATATPSVVKDICDSFLIDKDSGVFRTPMYRPNLSFQVDVANSLEQKITRIVPLLRERTGPAIIYVTLQKHTEETVNRLVSHGLEATAYHAGLPADQRERIQLDFMKSTKGIVVATIAFGMGIDKADIRQVIHLHMPKTLEGYSQEVGRAGRDDKPSTCLVFLSNEDLPILEGFCRGDTCSRKDLSLWLTEVMTKKPAADGTLDFNHYQQSKLYDIRANVLGLFYAQLELDYPYIRAVTPYYAEYTITARDGAGWSKVQNDQSVAAKIIRENLDSKNKIDVEAAANRSKVDRTILSQKLNSWSLDGYIDTKTAQVRARYVILNERPKGSAAIEELAEKMYSRALARENEAVQMMNQVVAFATGNECLALHLARYFGDANVVPNGKCGSCTHCTTGKAVSFTPSAGSIVPDKTKVKAILNACAERDDPRLLARFAFGVTSPRLTANKLTSYHPLFGSMVDTGFAALLATFEQECAKAGYVRDEQVAAALEAATMPTGKRSFSQSGSSSSYTSRGRGGGSRGGSSYSRGGYSGGGSKRARRGSRY